MRDRRKASRGAAAIEFVFIAPVLMLMVACFLTLGLAGSAKFRLSDAAMVAARRCVTNGVATCNANALIYLNTRLKEVDNAGLANTCAGGPTVTVTNANSVLSITARCGFVGGVMQGMIGMPRIDLVTTAAMPF